MKEILILTKASLIHQFNLHILHPRSLKRKKDAFRILMYLLVIIALIPSYWLYIKFVRQVGFSLMMINQELYFTALAHYSATLIIFLFGLLHILSTYYFSRDTDMLIPLPIKGRHIVLSKFFTLLIYEYLILGIFLFPILIINQSFVVGGVIYLLKSVIIFLLTPIVPLSLGSFLIVLIMRFTNIKGKKDLVRVITMFAFLIVVLGVQIILQRSMIQIPPGQELEFMGELFKNNRALIDMMGRVFPMSKWVAISLSNNNLDAAIHLLSITVVNFFVFIVMIVFVEKFYLGGLIGSNESASSKRKITRNELNKLTDNEGAHFFAVFKVDWITLIKTPVYLFNCVSIALILPIIFIVMPSLSGSSEEMDFVINLYNLNKTEFYLGLAGAYMLFAAMNPTAPSSFSREGASFWITRAIPVRERDHILGKSIAPLILQTITIVIFSFGIQFYIPTQPLAIVSSSILGLISAIPIVLVGLLIDISRPYLTWDNPQRAVKQNMNVLISMGLCGLITAGIGWLTYAMLIENFSVLLIVLLDLILIFILSMVVYRMSIAKLRAMLQPTE
ncbi:MAG: hypothetical protein JXI43_01790 [Tissierellales bacterium]|nr:hypothetical protein [Tissierellales bacterium]